MLQAVINKLLSMDPTLDLANLNQKWICINCLDFPKQSIYFTFENNMMLFASSKPDQIDTIITATLESFIVFFINKQRNKLTITGDMDVAVACEKLFINLDIDWEEELSKHTGDAFAYSALNIVRKIKKYGIGSTNTLNEMITEYLQEESGVLPTSIEINEFMQQVDELRLRVDRLDAKVKLYESH